MYTEGQTLLRARDKTLWVYLTLNIIDQVAYMGDADGIVHKDIPLSEFGPLRDEFNGPLVGNPPPNPRYKTLKDALTSPCLPDQSLAVYIDMAEEEKERRRAAVLDNAVEQIKAWMEVVETKPVRHISGIRILDEFYNLCACLPNPRHEQYQAVFTRIESMADFTGRVFGRTFYVIGGRLYWRNDQHLLVRHKVEPDELAAIKALAAVPALV